ncbi:MBOAT family O-acyltransferase [Sphingomonas qilianensis]|uniref:Probable alginate O-acetylase AlgI n=1 Tax=Sphingomonas qilianensis TaxID=1736690 RepID=A0ABU9XRX0_9SPHN
MLFNSVTFLFLFLPIICVLYWQLRATARLWLLLIASTIFYGFWRIEFVPLMLGSAIMDYYLALAIDRQEDPRRRKRLMQVSIVVNLAILGFFKYFLFVRDSLFSASELLGFHPSFTTLNIILPLGISFYIFQTLSYTIDVYRRDIAPERSLLRYMTFVTFYPHLVAGPIMRPDILIPQLKDPAPFYGQQVRRGIERIIAGLFLKVVLADTIAGFVDQGFAGSLAQISAFDAWTLAFLFGFQIYFDFAGYSSIAIGAAMIMNIYVPENFNFPYVATSPREFWKRWHISLSTWIRDYVYIPLIGRYRAPGHGAWDTLAERSETVAGQPPVSDAKRTRALFSTWAIMGLWHGANWTFVLWGLYHAVMVWAQRLLAPRLRFPGGAIGALLGVAITLPLMMAAWIPFRAKSLGDTFILWGKMLDPRQYHAFGLAPNSYIMAAALTLAMFAVWFVRDRLVPRLAVDSAALLAAKSLYLTITIALVFVMLEVKSTFIYFQF